jgi:hypothetical protein
VFRMTDFKRPSPATAVAAVVIAAVAFGGLAGSASANDHDRGRDHRDDRRGGWNGGYRAAPPVVYGQPYYAPPLIYGPGLSINIR